MPTHMRQMFQPDELQNIVMSEPFSFTKGCRVMRIEAKNVMGDTTKFGSALYDLKIDPHQTAPVSDKETEERMKGYIAEYMEKNDAPEELYTRLGIVR